MEQLNEYELKCRYLFRDINGEAFRLTPGQVDIFRTVYEPQYTRVAIKAVTQYGKLISDDTPVLTTNGWKLHGKLQVGDKVFNHKGEQLKIKGISNAGFANLEVFFSNGTSIKVHENHEWQVQSSDWKNSRVVETKWLLNRRLKNNKGSRIYKLPLVEPLQFKKNSLPIDPYTFGVWLGDGTNSKPTITNSSQDRQIIENIPYKLSSKSFHKETGVGSFNFYRTEFWNGLRELGVLYKKHIPSIYLCSSIEQRLSLLAGLIDTDGSVWRKKRKNGNLDNRVTIINTNKKLVKHIVELIRGLGMRPSVTKVKADLSSSGIQGKKDVYYIGFKPLINIPTVISRKKIIPSIKKRRICIDKIKRINPISGRCIEVDSKDGIYLVGKNLIPTHNSEVASLALIAIAIRRKEKILIIAPSAKQASIIMGKIIEHLFDNQLLTGMIDYSAGTVERLRQERSKNRITFKNGSEIMMLTAEAKYVAKESKSLMGFGASIVAVDESSLIPDVMFSKIIRMVGGVENGKLIQLGNPFENNHFGRAFDSPLYHKISIDWRQALEEKRITQEFLDEARETISELDWTIFYECKFPDSGSEDALIPRPWIELSVDQKDCGGEHKQAGLDVARFGRDKTVYISRKGDKVERVEVTEKMDTMEVVGWVRAFLDKDEPDVLCIDVVGIGSGVYDRLLEVQGNGDVAWSDTLLVPINVGQSPEGYEGEEEAKDKFYNLRAQLHWHLRSLFKPDKNNHSQISIPNDAELKKQLEEIRYRYSSERKIKIEAKEEMKKRLGVSPDKADALGLAFWNTTLNEPELMIMDI